MNKDICKKIIKKKGMTEPRQCLRKINHSGGHTPNLVGMRIGRIFIKRLGPPSPQQTTQWVIESEGIERVVRAQEILKGVNKGKISRSEYCSINGVVRPEYHTVAAHHRAIFRSKEDKHRTYKGMPFCDDWNPNRGGAYWKGAKWIIDNLGSKPGSDWSLDIIKHELGFIPGNLRWARNSTQMKNQQHRALGQFSDEEFAVEAHRRGYEKVKGEPK